MSEPGEMSQGKEVESQPLLRFEDGTPVNITPIIREKDDKGFSPRLGKIPSGKTLIVIPIGFGEEERFLVSKPLPGQEKPNSVYVKRIRPEPFRQLKDEGYEVVSPTNIPESLTEKG